MYAPGTKILIVDDMMTMRKIVMKVCRDLGFENLIEANDGQVAWQKISENPDIGFVISDWNMPNCSGLDLLKRVRGDSRFKTLPFLLVTAEGEASQVQEAVKAGVDGYIIKPFAPAALAAKMTDVHKVKGQAA